MKWDDNKSPDHNKEIDSYTRISYLVEKIRKNREINPNGSIIVHCR